MPKPSVTALLRHAFHQIWAYSATERCSYAIVAVVFVLGATAMLLYHPFTHIEVGDGALFDYIGQTILRGGIPYRDVVDQKGPGVMYLAALAMGIAKTAGLRDIIGVRILNVLLVGSLSALTYMVAVNYFRSRMAGLIAFMVPLTVPDFFALLAQGSEPKVLMLVFGMLAMWAIGRDRPLLAGFVSMLACFSWQPGLMYTGVAFLIFSRYLTSWRDWKALKTVVGAAIPLVILVGYFHAAGALGDLWKWTIVFNLKVYGPGQLHSLPAALGHLWKVLNDVFEGEVLIIYLGVAGLVLFSVEWIVSTLRTTLWSGAADSRRAGDRKVASGSNGSNPDTPASGGADPADLVLGPAIVLPPLIYFLFSLINFQGPDDVIPFYPFIGLFGGWLLVRVGSLARSAGRSASDGKPDRVSAIPRRILYPLAWLPHAGLVVLLALVVLSARASAPPSQLTLANQIREFQPVADLLGPGDKIYVHREIEILVLLNKPNLNQYVFLDRGKDLFIDRQSPGALQALLQQMRAAGPKIAAISHLRQVAHGKDLARWMNEDYVPLKLRPEFDRIIPGSNAVFIHR
ncbi:MAG TPA: DolP-mannose mannosyltransferase [Blastocatellia bacterium]|nr:DolP-mannose mannosyltransferase [Blastocatellia bacterium]